MKTNIKNPGKKQHIDQKSIFQNTKVVSMLHDMCSQCSIQYSLYVCMVALVSFPGLPTIQVFVIAYGMPKQRGEVHLSHERHQCLSIEGGSSSEEYISCT